MLHRVWPASTTCVRGTVWISWADGSVAKAPVTNSGLATAKTAMAATTMRRLR
ncbi:MAG: hypothetical protein RLZZ93_603 [Actinomycetota bacterium]